MKKLFYLSAIISVIGFVLDPVSAYELPNSDLQAQYFCVFGLQSSRFDGNDKADPGQVFYFDVPENQGSELIIDVFDPDTGGKLDQKDPGKEDWETIFQFAVYGKEDGLVAKKSFSDSMDYDLAYYRFGPYPKEMGAKIKGYYRFKLAVSPVKTLILKGDDLNLFRVRVYPENVMAFSEKISLRLPAHKNEEMYFYPEIPAGESEITVENYDLDAEGGSVRLYDPLTQKNYRVDNSGSGVWAQTTVHVDASDQPRCLEYIITKKTQQYGNVSIRVKDRKGRMLPIYYPQKPHKALPEAAVVVQKQAEAVLPEKSSGVKQKSPVMVQPMKTIGRQCNKFIFDGTASYDPDNEKLSFLWDFNDSTTSTEPIATHVFEKGGQYKVTLTVKDSSGLSCDSSSKTQVVNVNIPPVPAFIAPETACVNQGIAFDASSTTDDTPENLTYIWDFADGTTGEGKQITKKFAKGGTYKVNLTVNDNANTACSKVSLNKSITVNTPPIAAGQTDFACCINTDSVFDGAASSDADGDSLTYQWEFGDGGAARSVKTTHRYNKGGVYTVTLKVDDNSQTACSSSQASFKVRINEEPVPVIKVK